MAYRFLVKGFQVCERTDIVPKVFYDFALAEDADDIPCDIFTCHCYAMDSRGHNLDNPRKRFCFRESDEWVFDSHIPYQFNRDIMVSLAGFLDEILERGIGYRGRV